MEYGRSAHEQRANRVDERKVATLLLPRVGARLGITYEEVSRRLESERGLTLSVSAGVHSEFVVVRENPSPSGRVAYEVIGRAPDVATRLAARAAPGEILASDDTGHMLRGEMLYEAVDYLVAPDASRPLAVVRILGETPAAVVGSTAGAPTGPLIERSAELDQLKAAWRRASDGPGRSCHPASGVFPWR